MHNYLTAIFYWNRISFLCSVLVQKEHQPWMCLFPKYSFSIKWNCSCLYTNIIYTRLWQFVIIFFLGKVYWLFHYSVCHCHNTVKQSTFFFSVLHSYLSNSIIYLAISILLPFSWVNIYNIISCNYCFLYQECSYSAFFLLYNLV